MRDLKAVALEKGIRHGLVFSPTIIFHQLVFGDNTEHGEFTPI